MSTKPPKIKKLKQKLKKLIHQLKDLWFEFNEPIKKFDRHGYQVLQGIYLMKLEEIRKLYREERATAFGHDFYAAENRNTQGTIIIGSPGCGKTKLLETIYADRFEGFNINPMMSAVVNDPKNESIEVIARILGIHPDEPNFPFHQTDPTDLRGKEHDLGKDIPGIPSVAMIANKIIPLPERNDGFYQRAANIIFQIAGILAYLAYKKDVLSRFTIATWLRTNYTLFSRRYSTKSITALMDRLGMSSYNIQKIHEYRAGTERASSLFQEIGKTQSNFLVNYDLLAALAEGKREKLRTGNYSVTESITKGQGIILSSNPLCPAQMAISNSIIFTLAIAYLLSLPDNPLRRCFLIFDEGLATIPLVPNLKECLEMGRGKGLCPIFTILNTPGLIDAFAKTNPVTPQAQSSEFLSLMNNFYLGGMSRETADYLVNNIIPSYRAITETPVISRNSTSIKMKVESLPPITAEELTAYPPANARNGSRWCVYLRSRSCHEYQLTPKELASSMPPSIEEIFGEKVQCYHPMTSEQITEFGKLRDWTKEEVNQLGLEIVENEQND